MLRKAAFLFVLLANVIILVHSFFPHHHHIDHLCVGQSDCHNHSANCHPQDAENTKNPGHETDDCCQLRQIKAIPVHQHRQHSGVVFFPAPDFFCVPFNLSSVPSLPDPSLQRNLRFSTFSIGLFTAFYAEVHSFRGPPVI